MDAKAKVMVLATAVSCAAVAATATDEAEFALDNVLATRRVRSGETVRAVRDAAWAEGGVTFSMTGTDDQVLTEGIAETVTIPQTDRIRVINLALTAGDERYCYSYLVVDGGPNVLADASAEFPLDSRTGVVRKARDLEPIAYSDRWNADVASLALSVQKPDGTTSDVPVSGEGVYGWSPYAAPWRKPGVYTLSHIDEAETLSAAFRVAPRGINVIIR